MTISKTIKGIILMLIFGLTQAASAAQPLTIDIDATGPGQPIDPMLYGVFFEDINFAADGGLSAELIKDGSFEFMEPVMSWRRLEWNDAVTGFGLRDKGGPFKNNPHYVHITLDSKGQGGLYQEGYRGMGFKEGARYRFSTMARLDGKNPLTLHVELANRRDEVIGSSTIEISNKCWKRFETELTASQTAGHGKIRIYLDQPGAIDLDAVSLMPIDTWKGRENGLRADLVQRLADLKPGFVRFPGGCIVEGRILSNRYQWKNTVGPVDERKIQFNRWQVEFANSDRAAADYYQSYRVGFYEYFLLSEDIGAEPLPILNCGMACQFNSGELAPMDELDEYIDDALDLVEFANGSKWTKWGRVRINMGHPEPFNLKVIGIGNEQWGPQYYERYEVLAKAVREKYPEIKLVFAAGPFPWGDDYYKAWNALKEPGKITSDYVDEHCYAGPDWFLDNAHRYDSYERKSPKIFMGEYAAHVEGRANNWESALAESAFMTGFERNADIVALSAYAPLLAHVDAWQWRPDLIWFDNLRTLATPNYYAQQLFSLNHGDAALPTKLGNVPRAENGQPRVYATASRDDQAGEWIVKLVNATSGEHTAKIAIKGATGGARTIKTIVMQGDLSAQNTFETPDAIVPQEGSLEADPTGFDYPLPAHSVTVMRMKK